MNLLAHLPQPSPDIERLLAVLQGGSSDRIPLIELAIDPEVCGVLLGEPLVRWDRKDDADRRVHAVRQSVGLMHRLGYDYVRLRTEIPFPTRLDATGDTAGLSRGQRQWQNEHSGPIQSEDDFERYPWPERADIEFGPAEEIADELPEGMACIAFSGGVLEWASALMGMEALSLGLYDAPELVRAVVDRVGRRICDAFETWCEFEHVAALWCGDDFGFKTATLISPDHLRSYILPWHQRFAELAHRHDRPYILHSCGHKGAIMADLIDTVGIDAIHSFEDIVEPVDTFAAAWGDRVAVLGGIDVDLLSRGNSDQVRARTLAVLEACAPTGRYAAGSGNSITNYVSVENYLAMVETIHRFNGRM